MRSAPLGAPHPLPEWVRPLARAIVGNGPLPAMTSGTRTARALKAAGARGAATGRTVHLPEAPVRSPASLGTLAHELVHAAEKPTGHGLDRPRMFRDEVLDRGERHARAVGDAVSAIAGVRARAAVSTAAGRGPVVAMGDGRTASPGRPVAPGSDGAGRAHAHRTADGAPPPVQRRMAGTAPDVAGADQLPVGGPAGLAVTVVQRFASPGRGESEGPGPVPIQRAVAASRAGPSAADPDRAPTPQMPPELETTPPVTAPAAAEVVAAAAEPSISPRAETGMAAMVGSAASSAVDSYSQVGELIEALEERVLAEIERRGGRFAGVF